MLVLEILEVRLRFMLAMTVSSRSVQARKLNDVKTENVKLGTIRTTTQLERGDDLIIVFCRSRLCLEDEIQTL